MLKSSLMLPVSAHVSVRKPPSVCPSKKLSSSSVSVDGSKAVLMTSALKSCSLSDAPIFRLPGPSVRVFAMIVFLSVDFKGIKGDFVGREIADARKTVGDGFSGLHVQTPFV